MFGQYLASYYSAVLNRAGEAIISMIGRSGEYFFFFFFNDPPPTEIYPLSLHDALPICLRRSRRQHHRRAAARPARAGHPRVRRSAGAPPRLHGGRADARRRPPGLRGVPAGGGIREG